ncbi:Tetratricopeptide repeat-containing protein [Mariniphaga anaerophila]|uniref:Tetratricopeptide repeat-containing protein n=1 Tax=Mariniphaga anaerophila TaxID=1484053 RepID=A0A1M5EK58_9BACT|nr:tetratricopeptide repeat protein [Mariniphaga anaerophila]SHF79510.1 Tetratricopeptide repeat-containing protein [Mariniphaga anaerophila]
MRKTTIKWFVLFLFTGLLFACSGTKKAVKTEKADDAPSEAQVKTEKPPIEEQKQMEFDYLFVDAIKEKSLGNRQKAIQLLSGCLEIDPNSSAAMYELATLHADNNDFTSASLLLEKAIQLNPENKWYSLLLAQIYQQTRRFNDAAIIYDKLLQKEPDNLEFLYMKAALLAGSEKNTEAIVAYNKLEEKLGVNEQISVAKQQLYVKNGEVEKAFGEIEKLIESNPEEPKYYGLMADLFQSQGDSVNALKYYKKIKEIDPENGFVHFSLANYYLQNGQPEKSFEETKKGFRSNEVDLQTKLQLYLMLTANPAQSGIKPEQEKELVDILQEAHPNEYLVYTVKAESLLKSGKLKEARSELLEATKMEKNDYALWERVLFIDNDLQDWQGLYSHSNQAMELFPNQPQVYFLNAVACIQLEKYDETASIVDEGLMYVVDNKRLEGQFLMLKGEALYKTGKMKEAFGLFDKSVDLDPENYIALNNYAYYLSLTGDSLDKAERMSGKVIERFPENSTYLDTYAWVLFKKGEYKLAKFYMESAIKNDKDQTATLLEHYGDILFKLEQTDEAVKYWEKAKNMGDVSELLDKKIRERKYFEE